MISRIPVELLLYGNVLEGGGFVRNATEQLKRTWRRSIRDIGGYWIGTAEYEGSTAEMLDIFQNGLQYQIQERAKGLVTWQGFIATMEMTYRGQTYFRDWTQVSNRVKTIYSKIGENLIDNPSCESAVWDAFGTPTTREQSTAWVSDGTYSAHIVTDAGNEGVTIDASMTIEAGKAYQGRVTINVISGTWALEAYSNDVLDVVEKSDTGVEVLYIAIPEDNAVTGVGLRLYSVDAGGECYADAAVFQLSPTRAETTWLNNTLSQAEYGVVENILLQAGMSDEAAESLARTTIYNEAWASVLPPRTIEMKLDRKGERDRDRLFITFLGYAFTLRNRYTSLTGTTDTAYNIMTSLLSGAQLVSVGSIYNNALVYHIDQREAYRVWDAIRDLTKAGNGLGDRFTAGVYRGRRFWYDVASTTIMARVRNGNLVDVAGGPLNGWMAEPGLVALDDMPRALDTVSSRAAEQGRVVWMNEVEFDLGAYLDGESSVTYRQSE